MESCYMPWSEYGTWRVVSSRLLADGQAMTLELGRDDGFRGSMTAYWGKPPAPAADLIEKYLAHLREATPETQMLWIDRAPEAVLVEFATPVGSSLCQIIASQEAWYLNLLLFDTPALTDAARAAWRPFFEQAELRPQSIGETLFDMGLPLFRQAQPLPPPRAQTPPPWTSDPRIRAVAHPAYPDEVPVWTSHPAGMARVWVRLLDSSPEGHWIGVLVHDPLDALAPGQSLVVAWDPAIRAWIRLHLHVQAAGADWALQPCDGCGLAHVPDAWATFPQPDQPIVPIPCPFCRGHLYLRDATAPVLDGPEPLPALPKRRWWDRFFRQQKSRPDDEA
ncbi:MAG: hypothetical protein OHK0039_45860 [Bacteroidia bacterium]